MTAAHAPPRPTPMRFQVSPEGASPGRFPVRVAGPDRDGGMSERLFDVDVQDHQDVLAFHDQLAETFGTRGAGDDPRPVPEPEGPVPTCLIDRNLDPRILYGYGDPSVLRVTAENGENLFHLIVTSNDAPDKFPILTSSDLVNWTLRTFAFDASNRPAWAADGENVADYWAPEVHRVGSAYLLCFAARGEDRTMSVGLARGTDPLGPFEPCARPTVTGNVIDPHIFVDGDTVYLYWKVDNNDKWPIELLRLLRREPELVASFFPCPSDDRTVRLACAMLDWVETLPAMERFFLLQPLIAAVTSRYAGVRAELRDLSQAREPHDPSQIGRIVELMSTPVLAQRLDPDDLALLGEPQVVLRNDQPWEAHLIEGLWVTRHGDRYYACYSGNDFSTADYGVGVAVADSPLGPFRKMSQPFVRSSARWTGPGHPCLFAGDEGATLFLHAFQGREVGYKAFRALLALPVGFTPEGLVVRSAALQSSGRNG